MGPPFFFQPFFSQFGAHLVIVSTHRRLSVKIVIAASSGSILKASIRARSSIRLLVVSGSWPWRWSITSPPSTHTVPQPPGPGFGIDEPSVKTPRSGPSVYLMSTSAVVRFSSRRLAPRPAPPPREPPLLRAPPLEELPPFFFGECSRQYRGVHPGYLSSTPWDRSKSVPQTLHWKVGMPGG